MGKSDPIIFEEYRSMLDMLEPTSIAFLGFTSRPPFISCSRIDYDVFDRSLGNWEINSAWSLPKKYDLIICTRCPYFAKDPHDFIQRCKLHLNPGGHLFVDWGLGDHWRFEKFKIGWIRDGEHEFAYASDNFLYSCLWREEFIREDEVRRFWQACRSKPPYDAHLSLDDLTSIIRNEVPAVIDYKFERLRFKFLWPDSPQLYIMTLSTAEML